MASAMVCGDHAHLRFAVREIDGGVEISAIDPVASMQAIENPDLTRVAGQVRDMLAGVVKNA